jgi:hypothetical protein
MSRTVERLVANAFKSCDLDKDGLLHYDQFKKWVEQTPDLIQSLEYGLANHEWDSEGDSEQHLRDTLVSLSSRQCLPRRVRTVSSSSDEFHTGCSECGSQTTYCVLCGCYLIARGDRKLKNSLQCSSLECSFTIDLTFCSNCGARLKPDGPEVRNIRCPFLHWLDVWVIRTTLALLSVDRPSSGACRPPGSLYQSTFVAAASFARLVAKHFVNPTEK